MVDNGASAAIGNLIGANNQYAPNPMGGYYGGMLMNQEQGNSALNQDSQTLANQQALEDLLQKQAQTPAVQAKAATDTLASQQSLANKQQYGQDELTSASIEHTKENYAKASDAEKQMFNNHMDQAYTASEMVKAYGNGDAEAGKEFIKTNKSAQDHINSIITAHGNAPVDLTNDEGFKHLAAAGATALQTKDFRQQGLLVDKKGDIEKAVATIHGTFALQAAAFQRDGVIGAAIATQPLDKQILGTARAEQLNNKGAIAESTMATVKSVLMKELTPEENNLITSNAKTAVDAVRGKNIDTVKTTAKRNGLDLPSEFKDNKDTEDARAWLQKALIAKGRDELVDKKASAMFPKTVPDSQIQTTTPGAMRGNAVKTPGQVTDSSSVRQVHDAATDAIAQINASNVSPQEKAQRIAAVHARVAAKAGAPVPTAAAPAAAPAAPSSPMGPPEPPAPAKDYYGNEPWNKIPQANPAKLQLKSLIDAEMKKSQPDVQKLQAWSKAYGQM